MTHPIHEKLVISIASSALFDLSNSDNIYQNKGIEEYRAYQEKNLDIPLNKGIAFPFIRRFLQLNQVFIEEKPVEVVLLSRNSVETGLRIFRSIMHYGLDISRAAFMNGKSPYQYLPAFNSSLFLSTNIEDVKNTINANYPAGIVLPSNNQDDELDNELRIAFDFDGVIADDEAERIYKQNNNLNEFQLYETNKQNIPLKQGLMANFCKQLSYLQKLEQAKQETDKTYKKLIHTAIITARSSPTHERVVTTLKNLNIDVDEFFLLGGIEKARILNILKPHIFFDDQLIHLDGGYKNSSMVHIPFGIANQN